MKKVTVTIFIAVIVLFVLNTGCNPKRNPITPDLTPVIPGITTPGPTQTVSS